MKKRGLEKKTRGTTANFKNPKKITTDLGLWGRRNESSPSGARSAGSSENTMCQTKRKTTAKKSHIAQGEKKRGRGGRKRGE